MEKLMASIIVLTVSISLGWSQDSVTTRKDLITTGAKRSWTIVITPQTTKHYLDSVTGAWGKENVVLSFSKLKYNSIGKLVKVKGSIDIIANGSHAGGKFTSDSLESIEVKADDRPGVSIKGK